MSLSDFEENMFKCHTYATEEDYCIPGFKVVDRQRGGGSVGIVYGITQYLGWICGSAACWAASTNDVPVSPGDIDVFFPNMRAFDEAVKLLLGDGWSYIGGNNKLHRRLQHKHVAIPVNLIVPIRCPWFVTGGTLEEVLKSFDFTVCAIAYNHGTCVCHPNWEEHETKRKLVFQTVLDPYEAIYGRIPKYQKKGYKLAHRDVQPLFDAYESVAFKERMRIASESARDHQYNPLDLSDKEYAFTHYVDWDRSIIR